MIDLRSDTVTKPTPAMRRAMMEAEVGDDVYGEDPTVNRLEQRAAEIAGKEAALFVPTGTMGNTIAVKLHTEHGQEVICDSRAHVLDYELAMMAWFSGCLARAIPTEDGILTWDQVRRHIRPPHPHYAPTGLIEIENTHNMAGGTVYPLGVIREICDGAHERGLKVHMDGARVFNAAAAMNVQVREIVAPVDTVMFCLSKALGAPVGSMLAGPAGLIAKGRLYRKRLGRDARSDAHPVSRSSAPDGRRFPGRAGRRRLRTDPALAQRSRPAERPVSAVVSDSSPLNYLALLSDFDLLRQVYHISHGGDSSRSLSGGC
jgi:threonine aldolase